MPPHVLGATFEVAPGAYCHHIENLGSEEARLAVFFDHELPGDNGLSAALSAYSDELLAAVFGQPAATFTSLPRFSEDVLLSPPAPRA